MGIYLPNMEMPKPKLADMATIYNAYILVDPNGCAAIVVDNEDGLDSTEYSLISVPPHGRVKKRVVYRGDVFNALESARIIALDGILTDRYKDGFHDGLKRALEILTNEVQDVPTIIPASEEGD